MGILDELKWRGMVHDFTPGIDKHLDEQMRSSYIGFDPTADSLHIGNLVQIMLLKHLQKAGHRPVVVVGGATGMIGDPSGKKSERKLLDDETLRYNQKRIEEQLGQYLEFQKGSNAAILLNNYDWFGNYNFISFLREVGKHITVNYMLAKDSVKSRLTEGISFTEFSYQLLQAYDFLHLFQKEKCTIQMGGADQWGNITTGTELIRRKTGMDAFAFTCPLITKSDGGKFGKTEEGNVWLDPKRTSVYKFFQFWLNVSDEEARNYIRIFTFLDQPTIVGLESRHEETPGDRILQKELAKEVTIFVHSEVAYLAAVEASNILFGDMAKDKLRELPEEQLLEALDGVPQHAVSHIVLSNGMPLPDFLSSATGICNSKGEARRMIEGGGIYLNKEKVTDSGYMVNSGNLLNGKYILIQKGKKKYHLIKLS